MDDISNIINFETKMEIDSKYKDQKCIFAFSYTYYFSFTFLHAKPHTRVSLAPSLYSIFSFNKNSTKFKKFFEIRYIEERTQQQHKGAEKTKKKK